MQRRIKFLNFPYRLKEVLPPTGGDLETTICNHAVIIDGAKVLKSSDAVFCKIKKMTVMSRKRLAYQFMVISYFLY